MDTDNTKTSLAAYWVAALLAIAIAEAIVCLILFIPQSKALRDAAARQEFIEAQLREVEATKAQADAVELQLEEACSALLSAPLFANVHENPGGVVAQVAQALEDQRVTLLSFAPPDEETPDVPLPTPDASTNMWKLRCKGTFPNLAKFLNQIEMSGVILDANQFVVDATFEGGIQMEVVLAMPDLRALSRGHVTADSPHTEKEEGK